MNIEDLEYKVCKICGKNKPLSDFTVDFGFKDNHVNSCKKCESQRKREYRKAHPEYREIVKNSVKKAKMEQEIMDNLDNILGGYRIHILKYCKEKEYKFNIVTTDGRSYRTNTFTDFIDWLMKEFGNN